MQNTVSASNAAGQEVSSPRTRGCSRLPVGDGHVAGVFPAHAGLFLGPVVRAMATPCLPRARGAVPGLGVESGALLESSPRTRGCSRARRRSVCRELVFPAHAGLFPKLTTNRAGATGLPRARGAVPNPNMSSVRRNEYASPKIFPAHAGLFPTRPSGRTSRRCLPRARGAVPNNPMATRMLRKSSPRTRGCSGRRAVSPVPAVRLPSRTRGCSQDDRLLRDQGRISPLPQVAD